MNLHLIAASLSQASATGLFRLILILLIIYMVYRILTRFVFPWALKAYLGKVQREFFNQNPHLRQQEERRPEGEVSIDQMPDQNKRKSRSDDSGEYVDYQEIKD